MQVDVAIVGGTGVGDALMARAGRPLHVPTEAGWLRGRLFEESGLQVLLVHRHSRGHKVPPHAINYRAMALGLRSLGVRSCVSSAAVGSLRADWPAGTLAICSDFVDVTGRNLTLFERRVEHTDFSLPFDPGVVAAMVRAAASLGLSVHEGAVYVCANGPRYETPQEVRSLAKIGDVVGMTVASEAIAMREAGVAYGCLAAVTNLAAGLGDGALSHEDVVLQMKKSGERTLSILLASAKELAG